MQHDFAARAVPPGMRVYRADRCSVRYRHAAIEHTANCQYLEPCYGLLCVMPSSCDSQARPQPGCVVLFLQKKSVPRVAAIMAIMDAITMLPPMNKGLRPNCAGYTHALIMQCKLQDNWTAKLLATYMCCSGWGPNTDGTSSMPLEHACRALHDKLNPS